ncbi:hypothetical protein BsWGS_03634 [Bradybaena similaris]
MLEMDVQCAYVVAISLFILLLNSVSSVQAAEISKGHWGPWGPLSPCSVTCGLGIAVLERMWIPGSDEKPQKVPFTSTQMFSCTDDTYPECPQNGTWSGWGAWSGCTKVCGGGIRERHRECRGQTFGGRPCEGDRFVKEDCNRDPCPPLPKGFDMSQCEDEGNFTCVSKKMCIPVSQRCDVTVQCHDGSDEDNCPSFNTLWGNNIRYDLSMGRNGNRRRKANKNGGHTTYSSSICQLLGLLMLFINVKWMLH